MRELSLNVMDIAQNSVTANSSLIKIEVIEDTYHNTLEIIISDNGKGMTEEQINQVENPFFTTRTTRKVGLGIPLFKMAATQTGGSFKITSELQKGTETRAKFITSHLDMTPLGDINSTIQILIRCNPNLDFVFYRKRDDKEFTLQTTELREVLGDVPLDNNDVQEWIKEFLSENTKNILEV